MHINIRRLAILAPCAFALAIASAAPALAVPKKPAPAASAPVAEPAAPVLPAVQATPFRMPQDPAAATTAPKPGPTPEESTSFAGNHEVFVVGDYVLQPRVYNEYSAGYKSKEGSYAFRGAAEFNIKNIPLMIGGYGTKFTYNHEQNLPDPVDCSMAPGEPACVTNIGKTGNAYVPKFVVHDYEQEGHIGLKLLDPRVYVALSYLARSQNTGYPIVGGLGLGLEKLPDYDASLSVYFSAFYYPNLTGRYTSTTTPTSLGLKYRDFRYQVGAAIRPDKSSVFIDAGVIGDRITARGSAPSNQTHFAPYAGVGVFTH